jgi:hypothetical protein
MTTLLCTVSDNTNICNETSNPSKFQLKFSDPLIYVIKLILIIQATQTYATKLQTLPNFS